MTEHCDCLSLPPLHEAHRSVNDVWDSSEDNGSGSGSGETMAVKIEKEREDTAPAKVADDDGEVTVLLGDAEQREEGEKSEEGWAEEDVEEHERRFDAEAVPEEEGGNDDEGRAEDRENGSSDQEGADEAGEHRWWKKGNDSKAYSKQELAYSEDLGIFGIFRKAAGSVAEFWTALKTAELGKLATKFASKVKKSLYKPRRSTKPGQAFKVGNVRLRRTAFKRFGRGKPSAFKPRLSLAL